MSTVGSRVLVAVTGLALVLYLIAHLAGNLLLFLGPAAFNAYAHSLASNPLIVPAELGLAAIFLLHAFQAIVTWTRNRGARPERYCRKARARGASRKSLASTTMAYTGILVAVFVVIHVRTFRYGPRHDAADGATRDLHRLVTEVFQDPLTVVLYEAALVLVGFHLWHGASSAVESLGGNHPRFTPWLLAAGKVLALAIAGGFLCIPLWAYATGGRP